MRMMLRTFRDLIKKTVVVYFDGILIYSWDCNSHLKHLCEVFAILRKEQLFVNLNKCCFLTLRLVFLGFILTTVGIHVDDEKIQAI